MTGPSQLADGGSASGCRRARQSFFPIRRGDADAAGQVVEQARRFGCPTVGIFYPRGETGPEERTEEFDGELRASDPSAFATLIGHCVQVGVDMGFDLIKTQYTGSEETFRRVMDVAGPFR